MSLERTELRLLDEKLYLQRRNLATRLNRRIAGDVGQSRRILRARYRRRERDLYHRRVVAGDLESPDKAKKRKKKLPRPRSYLGSRLRLR